MKKCSVCEPRWCGTSWLYVVAARDGGYPVKVGISRRVGSRVATHRKKEKRSDLYVAHRIEFPCDYIAGQAETMALKELAPFNVKGDWFGCTVECAVSATLKAEAAFK